MRNETVSAWASLGGSGRFPANVARDMHRWTRKAFDVELELYYVKLTVRNPHGPGVIELLHPCLLPHELIGAAFAAGGAVWESCFGKSADVAAFWQHVLSTHDDADWYDDMHVRIPICLHGDGAPCFNGQSIMHFCFSSPLASGDALASRFVVTSIPNSLLVPGVTVQQVLNLIQWSITIAAAGRYPERGFRDEVLKGHRATLACQQISGQWKVAFYGLKGDLEWLRLALGWVQNYNCNLCCPRCRATKNNLACHYTDVREASNWHATMFTEDELNRIAVTSTPLQRLRCFRHERVLLDLMHVLHLGILKKLLPCLIIILASWRPLYNAGSLEDGLELMWAAWDRWRVQNKISAMAKRFCRKAPNLIT